MFGTKRLTHFINKMGLWSRIAITITIGFFIFFTIFSLLSLRMVSDSTNRILEQQMVITQMAADEIDGLLARGFHELEKATDFARFDPDTDSLEEEYHMLAHAYGRIGTFSMGIYFYDATGKMLLSEPFEASIIGTDHSTQQHIRQIMESGVKNVSTPFQDPVSGTPVVALTIPINNEQGQLMSMLSGIINLSSSDVRGPIENAYNLGHSGHAEIVDRYGRIVVTTLPRAFLDPGDHVHWYQMMMGQNKTGIERVIDEHEGENEYMHIMSFVPLAMVDWGVTMGGDASETLAPVTTLRNNFFLLGGLMLVIILTATLIGTRRLVRPINALTQNALRITEGDLTSTIQISTGGEIGVLGKSFEEMRLKLQMSIDEAKRWNQELEQRVTDRTEGLEQVSRQLQEQNKVRSVLLKKIITAQEEERRRIARELHDDVGSFLASLVNSLGGVEELLDPDSATRRKLEYLRDSTSEATEEVRRIIRDLRPGLLDELGLVAAVARYVDYYLVRSGVKVELDTKGFNRKLPSTMEITLFRIVQEAITNIIKHAKAKTVYIRLQQTSSSILGSIDDDGVGFDMDTLYNKKHSGMAVGLLGMEERIDLLEGEIDIKSQPQGGTHVQFEIPWQESDGEENPNSDS